MSDKEIRQSIELERQQLDKAMKLFEELGEAPAAARKALGHFEALHHLYQQLEAPMQVEKAQLTEVKIELLTPILGEMHHASEQDDFWKTSNQDERAERDMKLMEIEKLGLEVQQLAQSLLDNPSDDVKQAIDMNRIAEIQEMAYEITQRTPPVDPLQTWGVNSTNMARMSMNNLLKTQSTLDDAINDYNKALSDYMSSDNPSDEQIDTLVTATENREQAQYQFEGQMENWRTQAKDIDTLGFTVEEVQTARHNLAKLEKYAKSPGVLGWSADVSPIFNLIQQKLADIEYAMENDTVIHDDNPSLADDIRQNVDEYEEVIQDEIADPAELVSIDDDLEELSQLDNQLSESLQARFDGLDSQNDSTKPLGQPLPSHTESRKPANQSMLSTASKGSIHKESSAPENESQHEAGRTGLTK